MTGLYEREKKLLENGKHFFEEGGGGEQEQREQFEHILNEYELLLNQAIRLNDISDKISKGLSDYKDYLLNKINIDELSGLYNRRYLMENAEKVIKNAWRTNNPISFLMVDIDNFKKYNDKYGHLNGDTAIKKISKCLKSSVVRASDFVVRYGGEEFCVVLPYTDKEGSLLVAERIMKNAKGLQILHESNNEYSYMTLSIGVTTCYPKQGTTPDMLFKASDSALYASKEGGRNKITYMDIS